MLGGVNPSQSQWVNQVNTNPVDIIFLVEMIGGIKREVADAVISGSIPQQEKCISDVLSKMGIIGAQIKIEFPAGSETLKNLEAKIADINNFLAPGSIQYPISVESTNDLAAKLTDIETILIGAKPS